jgi:hypothetical protein
MHPFLVLAEDIAGIVTAGSEFAVMVYNCSHYCRTVVMQVSRLEYGWHKRVISLRPLTSKQPVFQILVLRP